MLLWICYHGMRTDSRGIVQSGWKAVVVFLASLLADKAGGGTP